MCNTHDMKTDTAAPSYKWVLLRLNGQGDLRGPLGQLQGYSEWLPCVQRGYAGLDGQCQLRPSDSKAEIDRNRNGEVGEAVAQIPDEGMPASDNVGRRFPA